MPSSTPHADLEDLLGLLAEVPPFSALPPKKREAMAAASEFVRHEPGELVVDGFRQPATDMFMVVHGRVGLWREVESTGLPDVTERAGGFFGFSGMLTGRTVGPRVSALTNCTVARIPGEVASAAFVTPAGARFLTDHLLSFAERARQLPGFATTGGLIDQEPVVVDASTPLKEVARELTARRRPGVVVRLPDGGLGLVTDGSIRRRVLDEGLSVEASAGEALARGVPIVQAGASAGEVLIGILDAQTEAAIVTDRFGALQGVVGLREFSLSPTTADVALHEQLRLAASPEELVERSHQAAGVLSGLLARGLAAQQVIRVHSGLIDVVVRRALELCLAGHDDLPMEGFTWLTLGSNGRREPVLSSDLESAVVFPDDTDPALMARYRVVFGEVESLLTRSGFVGDDAGVSARRAIMSRTESEWRLATTRWLENPHAEQGGMMISLLVDSRPVFGDAALAQATLQLHNLRRHPLTMRLLLDDTLRMRPKARPREVPWRRKASLDVKHDALRPLVNLARWIGLAVRAQEQSTPDRLRASRGSALLAEGQADVLVEGFEVLQRVRLLSQLAEAQAGARPTNRLDLGAMSPIAKSTLFEVTHEIAVAQRRLMNVSNWSETADWQLPGDR